MHTSVLTIANLLPWLWHEGLLIVACVMAAIFVILVCVAGTSLSRLWVEDETDHLTRTESALATRRTADRGWGADRSAPPTYRIGSDLTTREQRLAKHPQRVS